MLSEERLCWLNSSIQLILSNNFLVEEMLKNPIITSTHIVNVNQTTSISNTNKDNDISFDFYSKIDESTIKYLFDILKSSSTKPLEKHIIQKYIEDLREHGPKLYANSTQEKIPIIQPMGQISSINDYLSKILLNVISNFIDTHVIWQDLLVCSQCHADNIAPTERHSLLKLFEIDYKGLSLPNAALENYFLTKNNNNSKTCNACGKASDQNQYCKEIVQLPDALFLSFTQNRQIKNDNNKVKPAEFFIQNYLNMSRFASPQLVCYPSYFRYQLNSVIISTADKEDNFHYYTFTKYGEQFYRCNDDLIEPVDKSLVLERKYSILCAMYIREKVNNVNFIETIYQILLDTENITSFGYLSNTHIRTMFDAALEYVARDIKVLSWSYGAVYTCLQCKAGEF